MIIPMLVIIMPNEATLFMYTRLW